MAFNINPEMFGAGLAGLGGGIFGNSGKPYDKAMQQYQQWSKVAQAPQEPYLNAGAGALGNYQNWLQGQANPSQFINNLMGQYSQSPYANYLQQQSMRAGQNAASASGMLGSSPFIEQMQQNAANISSQDMNQWLQNVLGINTQYGQGQQNLVSGGQNSANALTNMYNQTGQHMAEAAYGKEAGKKQDFWNTLGGAGSMIASFLPFVL